MRGLLFGAFLLAAGACRSSSTPADCTCVVGNAGERRALVCGETACVGGVTFTCGDQDRATQRGACTATPAPTDTSSAGDSGAPPPPPPDTSCDDLRSFCSSACSNPASVAADCQSTASTGDPDACRSWRATNSILCRP